MADVRLIDANALLEKECCGRISGDDVRNAPTINPEDCRTQGHFGCDLCNGKSIIKQEYGSYDLEIDGENREITIWNCDMCIAVFPISYCPNCGAKMDGKENNNA